MVDLLPSHQSQDGAESQKLSMTLKRELTNAPSSLDGALF